MAATESVLSSVDLANNGYAPVDVLAVKMGGSTLPTPMTTKQAQRYGDRNMPADLRRAGFKTVVFRSDAEIHGGVWLRINYGARCGGVA